AVCGLGGIGKTQIAVEFAYRLRSQCPDHSIFWIRANDQISFETSYREVAGLLGIPLDEANADIIAKVNARLARADAGKWLMIIDNADDLGSEDSTTSLVVRKQIPRHNSAGILFTTRSRGVATRLAKNHLIKVDEMNEPESFALFSRNLQQDRRIILQDEATTKQLLEILCHLPLAMTQAAGYFNKVAHMTIEKYMSIFSSRKEEAMEVLGEGKLDDDMDDPEKRAVATTWLISFEQIQKDNELAAEYMKFIATIKDEAIPDDILPDTKYKLLTFKQEGAIGTLVGFGFLKQQAERRFYNMHRLVHLVVQSWLKRRNETSIWIQKASTRLTKLIPTGGHEDREKWTGYLPHGLHVAQSSAFAVLPEEERMSLFVRIGACQRTLGQYSAAERLHREMLRLREEVLGPEHPDTLTSMNNLACLFEDQGKYEAAEPLYEETLRLNEKVFGQEHPDTLLSMNNLASLFESQGKQKVLGEEHPDTLTSMNNLANILESQGKYEAAKPLYQETLLLRQKILGEEHPDTLTSMNNLVRLSIAKASTRRSSRSTKRCCCFLERKSSA
ncbi:hypothetical protein DL98DRAFT_442843, partial [Cadophora sp. DSE1049]